MFYNTKIIPLFETSSDILHKNMFYNIFLDLHQNKKIRQEENKQEWQEMKRMTRQETRWQKKSEAASHWKQPHTTTFYFSRW